MKDISVHASAESEFGQAIDHYESCHPGLGDEFQDEVEAAFTRIRTRPGMFPKYRTGPIQKCFVRRFPYTIYFREFDDRIWLVAIAHQKRRPSYWSRRRP